MEVGSLNHDISREKVKKTFSRSCILCQSSLQFKVVRRYSFAVKYRLNVSLPLVTGELLQNKVDVNNVTYKLYNIKLQRLPVLLNTKNYLSTGQAIT